MRIDLDAIEAAVAKMTPWEWFDDSAVDDFLRCNGPPETLGRIWYERDHKGIVLLRNAAPALLALCRAGERLAEAVTRQRASPFKNDHETAVVCALTEYDRAAGGMP